MKSTPTTGYVPVTIQLPPALAAKFQTTNYDWSALVSLAAVENKPKDLADRLLDLYFEYSRLMALKPQEITDASVEQLYCCEQMIRALQQMDNRTNSNPDDHGAGAARSE